jgi:hypothetical protein
VSALGLVKKNRENGIVLIVCLALLLILSLIGLSSILTSNSDMQISGNEMNHTGAFYAAESGIEKAAASIATSYETMAAPPSPLPCDSFIDNKYKYTFATTDNGAPVQSTLSKGAYKGLYGLVKTFQLASIGYDTTGEASVNINLGMQDALIPLFQFGVFYEQDLEIAPGPNMTLGGRVHCNRNTYLQSNNNLNIDSYLTAAGDILHGRKPGSGQSESNGNVFIKDMNGTYQNMKNLDNSWLDSRSSDWVSNSMARWGGLVQDRSHDISELYLPVVTNGPATNLIDRATNNNDSYENKAGLKIVDNQALFHQADGSWLNIINDPRFAGVVSHGSFYDGRENKNVASLDIDLQKLRTAGFYPTNGIIYASAPTAGGAMPAVRLKNGSELQRSLTVATNNPLYSWGNFNTVNKKPAAFLADAITILSGNWTDANSWHSLSYRNATATQVNASFLTGNTETGAHGQEYNGGLENLVRFLEKWDGINYGWKGSAVDLWYSRQATGQWSYGSYYTAPNRVWAFDTDLLRIENLPPGTPLVNIVQRMDWKEQIYSAR